MQRPPEKSADGAFMNQSRMPTPWWAEAPVAEAPAVEFLLAQSSRHNNIGFANHGSAQNWDMSGVFAPGRGERSKE